MGLSLSEFDAMTPAQFVYACLGWRKAQGERIRHGWEMCRYQTWVLTCIQLDPKDRKPLREMFPMPWDKRADRGKEERPAESISLEERIKRVSEILGDNAKQ